MRRFLAWSMSVGVVCAVAVSGCDLLRLVFPPGTFPDPETGSPKLVPFESETELMDYFSGQVATRNLDLVRDGAFDDAVELEVLADGDASGGGNDFAPPSADAPAAGDQGNSEGTTDRVSQTTTQEVGVDEADVVKTDGKYAFIMRSGTLMITLLTPAQDMAVVGEIEIEGSGRELYLLGDKVVALSETYGGFFGGGFIDDGFIGVGVDGGGGESVAVDPVELTDDEPIREPTDEGRDAIVDEPLIVAGESQRFERPRTIVTVIDVSDPANPTRLSESKFDGTQASSRMIDGVLYLVVANYQSFYVDVLPALGTPGVDTQSLETESVLPKFEHTDSQGVKTDGDVVTWEEMYRPSDPDGFGVVTVISMNASTDASFKAVGIVAEPGLVYSSREALYLTDTDYSFSGNMRETTDIYKLSYVDGVAAPTATGVVPGRILNQYSMGEYEGFLRVATTVGPTFSGFGQVSVPHNNVYVLEQTGDELNVVGSVEDIAPRETIQSARFIGDRGYVVTFEQIDPFFTMDLADPRNPRVVGELKVPGFSTFIVPMDENHILTVGQYIPEADGFFRPWGVQLSIFDVTDFANPTLAHNLVIGEESGASSEALYNPKAFTYFAEAGMVALPVSIFEGGIFFEQEFFDDGDRVDESDPADDSASSPPVEPIIPDEPSLVGEPTVQQGFDGLYVYEVDAENGFTQTGRISTRFGNATYGPSFTRGVFIGPEVFAVTNRGVRGGSMDAVAAEASLFEVEFPQDEFDGPITLDTPFPAPADGGTTESGEGVTRN
jgi:Beta propeller domain